MLLLQTYVLFSCFALFKFASRFPPGESEFVQTRRSDQHPAAAAPHRLQRPEHHRSHSRFTGGAHPEPGPRAAGHRKSAPHRPDQVRRYSWLHHVHCCICVLRIVYRLIQRQST